MHYFSKFLVVVLSFALVEVSFALNATNAWAGGGMIPTSVAVSDLARDQNRAKVNAFLSRQEVQTELLKRGVFPHEAQARLANLSDFELQKLAGSIETAPAGADVIVISLTTVLLVVIILLLLGR